MSSNSYSNAVYRSCVCFGLINATSFFSETNSTRRNCALDSWNMDGRTVPMCVGPFFQLPGGPTVPPSPVSSLSLSLSPVAAYQTTCFSTILHINIGSPWDNRHWAGAQLCTHKTVCVCPQTGGGRLFKAWWADATRSSMPSFVWIGEVLSVLFTVVGCGRAGGGMETNNPFPKSERVVSARETLISDRLFGFPSTHIFNPLVPRMKKIKIRQFNFKLTFTGLICKGKLDFDTHNCELLGLKRSF